MDPTAREWTEDDWPDDQPVRQSMRSAPRGRRRRPSDDDKRIRRQMRRSGAMEQEESMEPTPERARLLNKIANAQTLAEQAQLVAELDNFDRAAQQKVAAERELDWANTAIGEAMTPVTSRTVRATAASDWLGDVDAPEVDRAHIVAQAALWYGQVPDFVKKDEAEFAEQARGAARQVTSGLGTDAEETFTQYVTFLRAQAASGLDQIEQTTAPDGVTQKPTPLPPETFDNFAPEVNDLNAPVVGTETSERAPLLQEIVQNDRGNAAPEVPGGHRENGELTGPAPEPSLTGGGHSTPEAPGGHSEMSAIPTGGGPTMKPQPAPKQAASGLPMVQQTVDVHDQPSRQQLPTEVAFPWTLDEEQEADGLGGQAEYDQGGDVPSRHNSGPAAGRTAAHQRTADTYTQPSQTVQPNVANSPATTPPRTPDGANGAQDAASGQQPSFGDGHAAREYTDAYTSNLPQGGEQSVPVSMGGDNGTGHMHPTYASRKVASKQEMKHPDFQRGYKYAMKWRPGTPLVRTGSAEMEAGIYAGLTDHDEHRQEWLAAHAKLAEAEPSLGQRIAKHRQFTHQVAQKQALATDGTYLAAPAKKTAATGVDLDTVAPTTSPSPTGDTPINGPGRPGPLAGGMDAAAPAGAAPYNGAPPYGQPVVPPAPTVPQGSPVSIPDTGMSTPMRAGEGLAPQTLAFRRTVQASRLAQQNQEA